MTDFFEPRCTTKAIDAPRFGIRDDAGDGQPAFPDFAEPDKWCATVNNTSGRPINFTAVDNCIEIRREDGNMENRCDVLLSNDIYLIFVELKDDRSQWIDHAVNDQLITTIERFKGTNDIRRYPRRFAYVCNRAHPFFKHSHAEMMQRFKQQYDVRLCLAGEITIKP